MKQLVLSNLIITSIIGSLVCLVVFGYPYLMNQWLWLGIAFSVWILCQGGIVYVRIEGPDDFKLGPDPMDPSQQIVVSYIQKDSRDQYKYEGFIMASLVVAYGTLFILILNTPKVFENGILKRVLIYTMLFGGLFLYSKFNSVIAYKFPSYGINFYPPDHYYEGDLLRNQGFTII